MNSAHPETQAAPPALLTIPETARELRVSRATAYVRIASGDIPTVDIGVGRPKTRVRRVDLDAYIARLARKNKLAS